MKEKVYCTKCAYFYLLNFINNYSEYICEHPSNIDIKDTWRSRIGIRKQKPYEKNKNNHCEDYEEKALKEIK